MGLKTIRVYKNTGFSGVDIPGTPAVLDTATYTDYPTFYYLRESIDLPAVKIRDNYDNLADVDYVRITDNTTLQNFYYFARPEAEAANTTILYLALDALLTLGGAQNLNYSGGWMTRGHIAPAEDTLFSNTAPEDFTPSRPLIVDHWEEIQTTNPNADDLQIVISNTDIADAGTLPDLRAKVIQGFINGDGTDPAEEPVMYLPALKIAPLATDFRVWDFNSGTNKSFMLAGTAAFNPTNSLIARGMSKLYSFGQLQLGASYEIPAEWLGSKAETTTGIISQLIGWHEIVEITGAPYINIQGIKNKKVYALFRTLHLINLASSDMVAFPVAETAGTDGQGNIRSCPRVRLWADPSSTGKPYAGFVDLHTGGGTGTGIPHAYSDSVHGAQWSNSQIVVEGASGSAWNSLNAAFSRASIVRNRDYAIAQNYIAGNALTVQMDAFDAQRRASIWGDILSMGGQALTTGLTIGAGAAAGGGVGTAAAIAGFGGQFAKGIFDFEASQASRNSAAEALNNNRQNNIYQRELLQASARQAINENRIGELKSNSVIAPSVTFTPEINLGLYGYNKFAFFESTLDPRDAADLDDYFQRFGYSGLHKPLTGAVFNTRPYYNFVQAFNINIKASGFGKRVRDAAIAQLNGGVRIWHVLPDASYYATN